ncbi:MAG: GNAT family N-acetyltransferase [Bacillota bacterium]
MKPVILSVDSQNTMRAFLEAPYRVYREKTVPPTAGRLKSSLRFSPMANPVLQHIRFANFVAFIEGQPVGRITASVDSLNPRPDEGFWGCFECIDDPRTARELFGAAAQWLKKQKKSIMIGPATLNTNQEVGLLIKGFENECLQDMPYNPPYYRDLVEKAGLAKYQDLECFKWELPRSLSGELQKESRAKDVVIRPVNYGLISREAPIVREISNKMMSGVWGYIPMTLDDVRAFLMHCARHVPPGLFIIAEVKREPAGMTVNIPYKMPKADGTGGKLRLAIGGLLPEFRQKGIHRLLLRELYKQAKNLGFTGGEASQVAESNEDIKKKVIKPFFGDEIIKIFRVYGQEI